MKRFAAAVVLALLLTTHLSTAFATEAMRIHTYSVEITKVSYSAQSHSNMISLAFQSNCEQSVVVVWLRFRYYDKKGERVFQYDNSVENVSAEGDASWAEYIFSQGLKPQKTDTFFRRAYPTHLGAYRVAVSIAGFQLDDGRTFSIREDQRVWVDSKGHSTEQPADTIPCELPGLAVLSDANSFALGIGYFSLTQSEAAYYNRPVGLIITAVQPGSLAEQTGLKMGDVIVLLDGISPTTDSYLMEKSKAKLALGETVEMVYHRDGEDHVLPLHLESK